MDGMAATKVSHWRHMPSLSAARLTESPARAVAFARPRSAMKASRVAGSQDARVGAVDKQSQSERAVVSQTNATSGSSHQP